MKILVTKDYISDYSNIINNLLNLGYEDITVSDTEITANKKDVKLLPRQDIEAIIRDNAVKPEFNDIPRENASAEAKPEAKLFNYATKQDDNAPNNLTLAHPE